MDSIILMITLVMSRRDQIVHFIIVVLAPDGNICLNDYSSFGQGGFNCSYYYNFYVHKITVVMAKMDSIVHIIIIVVAGSIKNKGILFTKRV